MLPTTRRCFLQSTLALGIGATVGGSTTLAIDPIQRVGKPRMRLSLAAYSFRKYLDLKQKDGPTMNLDGFVDLAAEMGVDAVEPTAYYFADTSPQYLANLKARCTRLGLDVSGGAVGNNFCHNDPAKLSEELQSVKQWIERYSLLGAKAIRVFAGSVPKGDSEPDALKRCIETLQQACDHAAKYGIYLAMENHGGITATPDQLLAIVKAVKHPCFGVNLDTGNFRTADPYADLAKVAPYAVNVQLKTEITRTGSKPEEADLSRLVGMLRDVGYRGYVALEYEAAEDPKTAVPKYVPILQKLMA